ncbi:probable histone-lysine N-methyltransferase CG1716 isoform X2 [Condylostylus longicornis]|uniref:probable histone-lysine N-methyltransferase CG1716 isoform X1 n=1 Tax=Condylostylus longicornis TaxID=2530218 RepID=UPI00244E57AB|nr:probable histone-lysine N-methyltransferase CG1716 isoform X1 [Condylostylus longicornis]XP_055380834.1 probable histone-lysine N-methyltransferase CG1716 isoform X2 [Condylostylus longicornis]
MGRTKNFNTLSANYEKSNADESENIDLSQNDEDNEDESIFQEQSQNIEHETTKNAKRQILINSMPSVKKGACEEAIKEVKRSRGRPRKNIADTETHRSFRKSYVENDDDLLKFENEVYENEDIFNIQLENSTQETIEIANADTIKQQLRNTNFEMETKTSSESVITISSEENSNSNPVLKTFHSNPNVERNLPSPEILHVQFNPSSTKTYKNKRKFVNTTLDNSTTTKNNFSESNKIDKPVENDSIVDKNKVQMGKPSPSFEINPNFVRNTRKKVLKYDVCDLLNKKSHKKIQIEARIDSMPAKSKLNSSKLSSTNPNTETVKNDCFATKVVPKINDLPSIIRKFPQTESDFPPKDISGNLYGMIREKQSPPKSLIQIQGKIVADNRLSVPRKISSQDVSDDQKMMKSYIAERKNEGATFDQNEAHNILTKRRPGRPKIKKESLNFSPVPVKTKTDHTLNVTDFTIDAEISNKKDLANEFGTANESKSEANNFLLEQSPTQHLKNININPTFTLSKDAHLDNIIIGKSMKNLEVDVPIAFKICEGTSEKLIRYEIGLPKKFHNSYNPIKFENIIPKDEKLKTKTDILRNFSEKLIVRAKEAEPQEETSTNNNVCETLKANDSATMCTSKQNENLIGKNMKEVRVLIKSVDNIKLKKAERCNRFIENEPCASNLLEETEESYKNNLNVPPVGKTETEANKGESMVSFKEKNCNTEKSKQLNINEKKDNYEKLSRDEVSLNKLSNCNAEAKILENDCKGTVESLSDLNEKSQSETEVFFLPETASEVVCLAESASEVVCLTEAVVEIESLTETGESTLNIIETEKIENNIQFCEISNLSVEKSFQKNEDKEKDEKVLQLREANVENNQANLKSSEEIHLPISTKSEDCFNEISPILLEVSNNEKISVEKNRDELTSTLEKSTVQLIKPKESKTGMDIWLEKVQMDSKSKVLTDSTKKKSDKNQKLKSKEENKSKQENKAKYDSQLKTELIYKGDHKSKEQVNKELYKSSNDSRSKKELKDKFENKLKLNTSKTDFKVKEEIKTKESKELAKQDRKGKDKDELKNRSETKVETKSKSDSFTQKLISKSDKEDLRQKSDKNNKNEIYNSLKNETSLRTIDIFNFAAKDEMAQKVYNKKKKKTETTIPAQDKTSKTDIADLKFENENDIMQKKFLGLDKSPKILKEKKIDKSIFNKDEDLEKSLESDVIKNKIDAAEEIKIKGRNKSVDEEESVRSTNSTSDLILKEENSSAVEKVADINGEQHLSKENLEECTDSNIFTTQPHNKVLRCDVNSEENFIKNLEKEISEFPEQTSKKIVNIEVSSFEKENKSSETSKVQDYSGKEIEMETVNQTPKTLETSKKLQIALQENQETNESTNEILDPLKDIESFLEAAGNLLSRSHSSDDEKESIGRRGIRNKTSDDKTVSEQDENKKETICDIEEKLKSIEGDNENTEISNNLQNTSKTCENENQDSNEKSVPPECFEQKENDNEKTKLICDLSSINIIESKENVSSLHLKCNILTPIKALQKEKREEWFDQIDSSIDKDLNDEVSFNSMINYNESTPIHKKTGAGPRTPPLPPPLSDEELDRNKMTNDNKKEASHFYEQNSLERDIADSIISTSIKIPNSMIASLHELKFMGSPKNQNTILDEQLKLIQNQIDKKSKKKSEISQKDRELKKFLKTLKKNELSKDWKKTYKELKKIKKKSAEGFAVSKSSLKYSPENDSILSNENSASLTFSQKLKKSSDLHDEHNSNNSTIRRSHRLKSIAMQQNQQNAIGRGGLVRNDYEDLIRADLAQVQAQNTKFLKAMENSLNQFKQIKENEYKCERVISKEAKRMMCDCFLTKEEEERGEYGCGEDCLNRLLMIECGPKCNVGDRCTNKRFQRGQYAPCRVFMTEKKGCGIFADVEIPAGEFIMEYVGEVVDSDQFEKRAAEYSACKNKHFYFMSLRSNAIIDATSRGNISRFINHSCDPNAETQKWTVNGELHIGFFTTRTVAPGEEITFDYQFQRYGKQAQRCFCEAVNCRGWIGEEPDSDEEIEEDIELDFKTKEDLEKISKDVQSYANKDKLQILEEEKANSEKNLSDKLIEPAKTKAILTDEEIKIKQQEREQRKKDKQRKREIRLAQQKHDFLEDPDLEDEIYRLSKTGLKNQVQTLRLSRLIVRAKLLQTRINLLEILRAGEIPCRRLFLDYHGLKLLHGWMNESESRDSNPTEDNLKMRLAILETLNCLPIPNKTMLKESKVYQIVQNWTQEKIITISPIDGSASDSNSGHAIAVKDKPSETILDQNAKETQSEIKNLAVKLINDWEVLPEVFRIPRKERVEQMKEHEREADRRYAALNVAEDERDFKTSRDRYKKSRWDSSIKQRWPNKVDINKERRKNDQEKLDDGLTKEQRRQAFAAKVAQDEAEKLNAEKRRNLEYEARREFEFKCKFFLLDCTKTHHRDIPFCVDQKTNTWYTLDKRKIPTPPSHIHIKIPPRLKSTNPCDYKMPKVDLPPGWKFAIDPLHGRIYYYHVKIRRPQWEPPPKIFPLVNPDNTTNATISGSSVTINTNDNHYSGSSSSDSEGFDETDALSLLRQERAISPRKEEDRVYNQNEMRRYKENKEKIRRRKEEIKRRKVRLLLKTVDQASDDININQLNESDPLPIADYLISSDEDDDTIVEELDSKLIEKIVKGESIVDELDALKIKKPLKRPLPIKEKSNGNGASNSTSSNITAEFKKRSKLEDKKHKNSDEVKKSKTSNKNHRYFARKAKEKFRSDIAGIIVQHLQPYRKDSCQVGKITTNEDFKHLARKLTHFVMIKELKHCDSTGQTLIVTDSVKNKSREFIKKYMAKYGETYIRPETDPEYKEIPL